jgi:cytochrome c-type biogenesis protein
MSEFSYAAAFFAGLAGFTSPCVLPLIPTYLSYLSGVASAEAPGSKARIFANTLAFVLGLALALSALGFLLGAILERITGETLLLASRASGAVIIVFGLYILGFIRIGFLSGRKGLRLPAHASLAASFLIGALFAVVWTPVMGAFLAFVIALALSSPHDAPALLFCYACGLGLPVLLAGAFASQASGFIRGHAREMAAFDRAMGLMVIIIGTLLLISA